MAQKFIDFGQAGAQLFGFKLQQAFASLCGIAFGFEIGGVLSQLSIFRFPLQLFSGCGFNLRG